ncbi:LytTR family DNA-binding domain-containing protein [Brevundimonas sp. 2R-24]|uniref:LytTR family DNA-binding domain-containing protein n=1 Tax=Peiella sedimenti TaxID=3061083 RepID=A0ABT8SH79_9CAUL|nr:LytTR family DNA-binding domain-containing protein [Caulobacteraceae bacterium XZ-24]
MGIGVRFEQIRPWLQGLAVAALAGLFLAAVGAFGSDGAPAPIRYGYWLTTMVGGAMIAGVAAWPISRMKSLERRPWLMWAVMSPAIAAPITVFVWLVTPLFFDGVWAGGTLLAFFPPVLIICAAMTGINLLLHRQPVETHAAAPGGGPAPFLERLPLKLKGAQVIAVQAEDHYLRIHTDRGSDLILMRLADAVRELEGIEGAQVHRSWWAARSAVRDVRRGDGRATLILDGGLEAPVSRTYARALRAEGWY